MTTAWQWLLRNIGGVEVTGFFVGVIALIVAAKEFKHVKRLIVSTERLVDDSKHLASDSKTLLDTSISLSRDTAQIANSMSTRFVGEFPFNLSTLSELLKKAASHVELMVDIVAYGHYSSPEAFLEYSQQLQRIALDPNVKLRMVVYGEKLTSKSRNDQFGGEHNFTNICSDPKFSRYFAKHKANGLPRDYKEFIDFLAEREDLWQQQIQANGADIRTSDDQFRFFLWLVDDIEAVFSFQMYGEHFHEICFRTRDGNLIRTFSKVFEQSWKESQVANITAA